MEFSIQHIFQFSKPSHLTTLTELFCSKKAKPNERAKGQLGLSQAHLPHEHLHLASAYLNHSLDSQ